MINYLNVLAISDTLVYVFCIYGIYKGNKKLEMLVNSTKIKDIQRLKVNMKESF